MGQSALLGRGSVAHCLRWVHLAVWLQTLAHLLILLFKYLESTLAKVLFSTMENYSSFEKKIVGIECVEGVSTTGGLVWFIFSCLASTSL